MSARQIKAMTDWTEDAEAGGPPAAREGAPPGLADDHRPAARAGGRAGPDARSPCCLPRS